MRERDGGGGMRGAPGFHPPPCQQQNKNEAEHHLFLFGQEFHAGNIPGSADFQRKFGGGAKQTTFTTCRAAANLRLMSQTAIPVTEAAKDFLRVIEEVERKRQPAVLTREGRPVATLNPVPSVARTCAELALRWRELERLPADEARLLCRQP